MLKQHKKHLVSGLATLLTLITLFTVQMQSASIAHASYTVTISPSQKYQTIQGWGSSLAWWANIIGGWSDTQRTAVADALFSPTKGLGLNVLRYNFGADGPGNVCHNQMLPGHNVPSFEPTQGNYVWTNDANQLWITQAAKARGANVFEGFVNSPPAWMLLNSCTAGGPGGAENLSTAHFNDFANYIATIDKHFHDSFGITMQTVDAFNEPSHTWWKSTNTQEGLRITDASMSAIIPLLATALAQNGASAYTAISAPDDNTVSQSINDYNGYSSTAKADVTQWNTHTYGGSVADRNNAYTNIGQTGGKRLWMSEWNVGTQSSQISAALVLSNQILVDERNLHPTAWVAWQAVNEAGDSINSDHALLYRGPNNTISYPARYYAMGNYSEFVHQGDQMLGDNDANSFTTYNASTNTLTIVTTNSSTSANTISYNLSNFGGVGTSATPYQTSATENLKQLAGVGIANKTFSTTLPAQSITTFVIPNVTIGSGGGGTTYNTLVNHNSGKVLEVAGASTANGAATDQFTNNGGTNQQWNLVNLGTGYYKIVNRNSGKVLEVAGASTARGAIVDQYTDTGGTNQQWSLVSVGGYYKIVNRNSSRVLDVVGQSKADGGAVDQWPDNGGTNQQWSIA